MKKGTGTAPTTAAPAPRVQVGKGDGKGDGEGEAAEFAAIPRPRTRHPLLALGAGLLALFLVVKMRADLRYFLSPGTPADLGDVRALVSSERGRAVLAEGTNRFVRVAGTPDRESALQVDTKGSWTFTQFFKLLGTDGRLFVHRREDPLPAFRAERDVFEGRLMRFSELSFEDAIRAHFAGHVSSTHFFATDTVSRAVAAGVDRPVALRDLTGDTATLGPNDLLAIVLRHPEQVEVALPIARFADPEAASAALVARGARVLGPGRPGPERHVFVIAAPSEGRDRLLNGIGDIDWRVKIYDVRETVKARLSDLGVANGALALRGGAAAGQAGEAAGGQRALTNIESIRTLGTVQIPPDAFLIIEADTPRDHLADVAVALVLLVFATVNLVGLAKGLRR